MLFLHITVHILEPVITDGMHDCQIINIAFLPHAYLQKADVAEKTRLTGVCFCFFKWKQSSCTTLMMSPAVRNVSYCSLPFLQSVDSYCSQLLVRVVDAAVLYSALQALPACSCCCRTSLQETDELHQPQINLQPRLSFPAIPDHH